VAVITYAVVGGLWGLCTVVVASVAKSMSIFALVFDFFGLAIECRAFADVWVPHMREYVVAVFIPSAGMLAAACAG